METILNELTECADPSYKEFHSKLIPSVSRESILGVRAPVAQKIAKKYANTDTGEHFLCSLPHRYYDENVVHAFMLGSLKCGTDELLKKISAFLPYVDNWAVCDGLCAHLKNLFKNPSEAYAFVLKCTKSSDTYTLRFGLVCLLSYYIDKKHTRDILKICKRTKSDEYYVNMALAWLISFCLIKEYSSFISLLEGQALDRWVHNKAIQKSIESYQIDSDKKNYLRSLKIK